MTSVMVFGASGMLGHKMIQVMDKNNLHVIGTIRSVVNQKDFLKKYELVGGVNVDDFDFVENALRTAEPDFVVNCIGIVKQLPEANDPIKSHTINSVFPHQLATYCESTGIKMIHISTDCVFDGKKGMYKETDVPNATDIYGRTKFTGEISHPHLTLRTSIIGRELGSKNGLLEWFLSQKGKTIQGYKNALFSGVTTVELSHLVIEIIKNHEELSGLYQVASTPISKYDLLVKLNEAFKNNTTIQEFYGETSDRTLNGWKLRKAIDYMAPSWDNMIRLLKIDDIAYEVK